jgi:hypothetical protein
LSHEHLLRDCLLRIPRPSQVIALVKSELLQQQAKLSNGIRVHVNPQIYLRVIVPVDDA